MGLDPFLMDDIRKSLHGSSAERQLEDLQFNLPQLDPSKVSSEASIVVESKSMSKRRGASQHMVDKMHSSGISLADAGTGGGLAYLDSSKGMTASKTLIHSGNNAMLNNSVDNLMCTMSSNNTKDGPNDNYDDVTTGGGNQSNLVSLYRNSGKVPKMK